MKNRRPEDISAVPTGWTTPPGRYIEFVKSTFPKGRTLDGIHLVVDCAHGAVLQSRSDGLSRNWARSTTVIGASPNGHEHQRTVAGRTHPEVVAAEVKKSRSADPASLWTETRDRVVFSDEKGNTVDGDAILAICAEDLLKKKRLKDGVVSPPS
jgi:phosphoglucosamine mutase